jgi:hypothetical protein
MSADYEIRQQLLKNTPKVYVISPPREETTASTEISTLQGPAQEGIYDGKSDLLFGSLNDLNN